MINTFKIKKLLLSSGDIGWISQGSNSSTISDQICIRAISDRNRNHKRKHVVEYMLLSYFYTVKMAKKNVKVYLICKTISIGNRPNEWNVAGLDTW